MQRYIRWRYRKRVSFGFGAWFFRVIRMWEPQIQYFKNKYRVITPSLPGFGKSNNVKSCNSIECMAQTVLNSLKKKKIEKFNLLGHSMGGMIVQE